MEKITKDVKYVKDAAEWANKSIQIGESKHVK